MTNCDSGVFQELVQLLSKFQLKLQLVEENDNIPGSYWGESEAGLIANTLYVRRDTPLHSALHEACHYICMDSSRRANLHTDAEGGYDEENGVCYLQIILAEQLSYSSSVQLMQEMDDWGYTFRLGTTQMWFEGDAEDAKDWLILKGLINNKNEPLWELRTN